MANDIFALGCGVKLRFAIEARQLAELGQIDEAVAIWLSVGKLNTETQGEALAFLDQISRAGHALKAVNLCDNLLPPDGYPNTLRFQKGLIQYSYLSDVAASVSTLEAVINDDPDDKIVHRALAEIHCYRADLERTRFHARAGLTGTDRRADIHMYVRCLSQYEEAVALLREEVAQDPGDIYLMLLFGKALRMLGRLNEALGVFFRILAHDPEHFYAAHYVAEILLLLGDRRSGWRRFDDAAIYLNVGKEPAYRNLLGRRWRGEDINGKRLLFLHYAGLGDSLMCARYGRTLRSRGAHVTLSSRPELLRLMRAQDGFDEVVETPPVEAWDDYDYWLLDYIAPALLGAPEGVIPAPSDGFIRVTDEWRAQWRSAVGLRGGGVKVGLCWAGNANHFYGLDRSISVERLVPLSSLSGVEWFVMQKSAENTKIRTILGDRSHDLSEHWRDFADSAAVMAELDLVISIDSAPLHLAGALGVPAWGLVPFAPDWRWGLSGDTSPWYPTLRLFRQPRVNDWASVIDDVRSALERLLQERRAARAL